VDDIVKQARDHAAGMNIRAKHWKRFKADRLEAETAGAAALLVSLADEVVRLREALRKAERAMTCGRGDDAHYCPNCDNTIFRPREEVRRALAGEQGDG